jgi:MtrB/PioB family decaheme-associated outer membrane protein
MRNRVWLTAALVLALAGPAAAQDPPTRPIPTDPVALGASDFTGRPYGTTDFGGRFTTVDGDEARFQRYRDLRGGPYLTEGLYGRRSSTWTLRAEAWNIGYRDQKYEIEYRNVGRLQASFLWDQIPMFISGDTSTLYTDTAPAVLRLEDAMQQQIQAATKTLRDFEDQAVDFELRTMRKISQADVRFNATRDTDIIVSVRNTNRTGELPYGGTFGFSNAVEVAAPIDTRTTDIRSLLEWGNTRGMVRVAWDGSVYDNANETMVWDNPLRFGPDASGLPSQGRLPLWPSNTLNYVSGLGVYNFARHGRVGAYLALGQASSNADLLPHTINTALPAIPLSRPTAEAEQQSTITQLNFSMRPWSRVQLLAKYRRSNVDVQTPIFERSGSVAYDSSVSTTPSESEYHSVDRMTFDADAAFEVLPFTSLKVGFASLGTDYTHRIWESTSENVFRASIDTTGNPMFMLRALYENRSRTGDGFEPAALIEVGELPGMRHFDVADRDRNRFTFIGTLTPGGIFSVNASAGIGRDDYPEGSHGLQSYNSNQYSLGVDVVPDDRYLFNFSYGWENYDSLQRSRNASSTTEQLNPTRDWTTDFDGKVRYADATLDILNVIEKTSLRFNIDWTDGEDTYVYGLAAGSPIAVPEQLPPVTSEILRAAVDVNYDISTHLRLGVAYWYEDYKVEDFAFGPDTLSGIALPPVEPGQPVVATNALLLGYQYRPYTAHVGFVRATYRW